METTTRYPAPTGAGDLTRRTTAGVLVAVVAALLVRAVVTTLGLPVGPSGATSPFASFPIVTSVVVAGVGAALVYAGLVRTTARPVRNFAALVAVVFLGMLVPVVAVAPALGVTAVGQAVLVVLHLVVAVPITAFVVGAVRL
ncbi:DUF6069 family protein [Halomicroarcula sp. GCM10025709]|uniref:DUF6069 family protein n=1 Tax=Haloarcula TaxID=2237 RepID=UPI0024C34902|nr:DUF6069 family protein [Halomicroarcula sp. YJ-61-S]